MARPKLASLPHPKSTVVLHRVLLEGAEKRQAGGRAVVMQVAAETSGW